MKKKIINMFYDIETSPNINILKRKQKDFEPKNIIVKPYLIGLFFNLNNKEKKYFQFTNVAQFYNFLTLYILKNNCNIKLYAFNATYDLSFIFPYFKKRLKGSKFIMDTKKYLVKGFFHYKRSRIWFFDLMRLWPQQKLKNVGEELGIFKKEINYKKFNAVVYDKYIYYYDEFYNSKMVDLKVESEYLKTDCMIIYYAYYEFKKRYYTSIKKLQQKGIIPYKFKNIEYSKKRYFEAEPLTVGTAGKKIMEMYLFDKYNLDWSIFQNDTDQATYNYSFLSYLGGFTSYNKKISKYSAGENEKIYYYDINSSYPFQMTKNLPINDILTKKEKNKKYVEWIQIQFTRIRYKKEYNFIKQNLLPLKPITSKLNQFVIEKNFFEFTKTMCIFSNLKIISIKYQELTKKPILKNYVNKLLEEKIQSKKDKNLSLNNAIKFLLNTPYGKMAQKPYESDLFLNEKNEVIEELKPIEKIKYRLVNTASFLVQNARHHLLKTIKKIVDNGGTFLYADTDSLTFVFDKNKDLNNYIKIHPYKLGYWDLEGEFTHFYNPKSAKKYLLVNKKTKAKKYAFSGFDKNIIKNSNYDTRFFTHNVLLIDGKMDTWKNKYGNIVLYNTNGETAKTSKWSVKWIYDIEKNKWYNKK